MRYIDADKMREEWLENGENEYVYDTNSVLDSIDAQPTADVVEVKHGEWVSHHPDGSAICSVCGRKQKDVWDFDNWQNFCGHCGADMRGGSQ